MLLYLIIINPLFWISFRVKCFPLLFAVWRHRIAFRPRLKPSGFFMLRPPLHPRQMGVM